MIARALVLGTMLVLGGCGVRTALDTAPDGSVAPRDGGAGIDASARCRVDSQCDDRLECNGVELCIGGRCAPGAGSRCDDFTACTRDQCVEGMGCMNVPDDSLCPALSTCELGRGCSPIRCTSDDECQDGIACNGLEACSPAGLCTVSSPPSCESDGIECTVERCTEPDGACESIPDDGLCGPGRTCDPARGCVAARCRSDLECDDRLFCTGTERCGPGGTCVAGTPVTCADGIACTDDVCDEGARGCVSRPSTRCPAGEICSPVPGDPDGCRAVMCAGDAQCRDMSVCNGEERCVAGRCTAGTPFECGSLPECQVGTCSDVAGGCIVSPRSEREICTNGVDDDCDERRDCVDEPDCRAHPACACRPSADRELRCSDGLDDDCDERIDCDDPDCARDPACAPGELFCGDTRDDDGDGLVDCADPDCATDPRCAARDAGVPPPIDAGPPRDGGMVANELGIAACTNGIDDDRDGRADCNDRDCRPFLPDGECCNGIDDVPGDDTPADVFTCRCFDDSTCRGVSEFDQVCWRTAFSVCAPRCNFFGGDTWCRSLMVGLPRCNVSTGECVP
ncbi:hypothetical protein [Sandaracinus amylolyticus]|uniref:hypothetical protein n=1 Tax=Sandaracinus amylolyticus TaxID=927083 RepID=UPI001F4584D9|nr:hypothetical protein [Sandaracinus amylolyticus]UJR78964.1 Hypothetical protein I5071_9970 [Sandaracinus amylolyticus]